jgi:proline-specific peptidase
MSADLNGRLVQVGDTRLYVVERGPEGALPLLVLHGGPGLDHTIFGSHLDALAEAYRLVLVDGREQGRSARGTDPASWNLRQHARDVSAVAASLGARRYVVLGHSFGAFVALQHAADFPGAAVATIVSSGVPSTRFLEAVDAGLAVFEPEDLREQVTRSWADEASAQTQDDVRNLMIDQMPWHFRDPRDSRIAVFSADVQDAVYSPEVLRASSLEGGGLAIEVEDSLPMVTQPVLVLAGRYDRTCVPAASEQIAALVPRSQLHVFEQSGHMTFVEQEQEYVQVVRRFLDECSAGQGLGPQR